jgi:hypothetical protein
MNKWLLAIILFIGKWKTEDINKKEKGLHRNAARI